MKKLFLLAVVFATQALAHTLPYNNPIYLKLSGGNPVKAQELNYFCRSSGRTSAQCVDALGGKGNLKAEAAQKCTRQALRFQSPVIGDAVIDERMVHKLDGEERHLSYVSGGETGRLHRYYYTQSDRDKAYWSKKKELYEQFGAAVKDLRDEVTKTNTSEVSGKGSAGLSGVINVEAGGGGTNTTTIEKGILTEAERKQIEAEAEKARQDPSYANIEPSGWCFAGEKTCDDGSKNPSYDPEVEKKEKEAEKKNGKKTSDNDTLKTPRHDDDTSHGVPDVISSDTGEIWAGNEASNNPDVAIATPVMDPESLPATWMEKCLERETRKLEQEIGTTNKTEIDPNEGSKKRAENLLKQGYCDESFYGRDYCAKYNFKQDSVVAVDLKAERQEHYKSAMERFKTTGFCDAGALGSDFCKGVLDKWRVNPVLNTEGKEIGKPSLILNKPLGIDKGPRIHP